MPQVYIKRPSDIITVQFDLREWVADRVAEGAVEEDIEFRLRATSGLAIETESSVTGLINATVSGGDMGRVYDIGMEARTIDGDSMVDMRKVRVRDPSLFDLLPSETEIPIGGGNRFVTDGGEYLVTDTGDYLVWE
jgi:hypothetical protein